MTVHFSILAVHEHAGLTTECMDAKKLDVDVKLRKAHNFWMGKCTACCVSIYRLLNARQMTQALSTLTLIFRTVIDCFVLSTSMPFCSLSSILMSSSSWMSLIEWMVL